MGIDRTDAGPPLEPVMAVNVHPAACLQIAGLEEEEKVLFLLCRLDLSVQS